MKKFTALVAFLLLSSWIFSQITVITTVITEPQCNGDCTGSANAVAIGGIAPYTYIWSTIPNQTGSVATGLCAGTYTVTAVDQTFSSGTGSATITEPAAIVITTSSIDASSCSTCDGEADASVSGGTTPYSYLWSDGQITATATGLCSGNYSVTVTDFNFCTDTANVTVNAVGGSGMTLTTTVNDATSSCFPCDGDAMVNVTGGTTPYTYQWNDFLSQTTQTATGLCPFTYSVTVTDNNGCSDSTNATVGSIGGSGMTLTGTSTDDTSGGCGTCNGTATLSVTGGVSPYSYQWPDGQTDSTATGLCTGDYTVSVTEANFCFDSLTITVNAGIGGGGITVTTSVTDASNPCFPCDGSATANATGGTTPYTYQWDDFNLQTTQTASALCPATYNVTVTDFTGCTGTATATVGSIAGSGMTLAFTTTVDSTGDCGFPCSGTTTVSVSGGTSPYNYQWDAATGNQTTPTATGLCAGTYLVTIVDAAFCGETDSVAVVDNTLDLNTSKTDDTTGCPACTGTATVTVTGGTTPYTYIWNDPNNQTDSIATGLCDGIYTVTVIDAIGCSDTKDRNVGSTAPFTLSLSSSSTDNTVACGPCDGTATVNATGGVTPYSYQWDDPAAQTDSIATGLCAGTYTVTVTDANGCLDTRTENVGSVGSPLTLVTVSADDTASCGPCSGTLTVSVTGGTTPYFYQWDDPNNQTDSVATGLCDGTYNVTVTDAGGCSNTETDNVGSVGPGAMVLTTSTTPAGCGVSNGTAQVTITGGQNPFTYLWSSGHTTFIAFSLTAGTYTVTVTDFSGCVDSASATVTNVGGPIALITDSTDVTCAGGNDGSATVTVVGSGTPPYSYQWDDPSSQNTPTATGLSAGTYNVTVTDVNSCFDIATVTINEPLPLLLTVTGTDPSCNGGCDGSATASTSSGTSPYTYAWNDGQTTQIATGLCAGTYTVTATDANGCSNSASVVISDPVGMALTTSTTDATCGNADGTATVSVTGGATPYGYLWSNGQTASTATGLASGGYAVTVSDFNGCLDSANVTINDIGGPSVVISSSTDVSCNGGNDGSATASATGGTTPYAYLWDDPAAQTDFTATGLTSGTYNVVATDATGCSGSASITINEPAAISLTTSSTDATCNGDCDGTATVSASGGAVPYSYQWDDPGSQVTSTANGLCTGTFNVTVADANGCTSTASVTVNEPSALTVSTAGTDPTCNGDCDGTAMATPSGGTSPYSYQWDDASFQVTQTAIGLCAGTYNVTVTDANGCTATGNITVTDPAGMTLTTSTTDATCGNADGDATVTAAGGTTSYSYLWNDPLSQTTATVTGLLVGGYSVTVTDANGCTETANVTINNIGGPTATITNSANVSCNGGNDGSATVTPSGGTTPYSYLWDDPAAQIDSTATGLAAGTYNVIVTDGNLCAAAASITISEPAVLNAVITAASNVTCNGGNDGSATVSASGGTTPYSYLWNDPGAQTTATATGLSAATYTVTVTDGNGCTTTTTATISQPPVLSISVSGTDPVCSGGCDGSATATASGGALPYSYAWNDPLAQATQTAVGLCAGTYTVTVTDGNGCTTSASVIINDPAGITLSTSTTDATCGNSDGDATVTAAGGTTPYSYLWDDPATQTTATATGLAVGGYSVTVTDANGCSNTANVTINNNSGPTASISSSGDVSCNGGNDGSAAASATGGSAPYTYLWDDPTSQIDSIATGLAVGTYNVVITDINGCAASASVIVSEPSAMITTTSGIDATCNGLCDGSATITASGGILPYSYLWDDTGAQTTATAIGLCVGNYNVTVTDANGCTVINSISILEPTALAVTTSGSNPVCSGSCDASASALTSGGIAPYSYQWDDPGFQATANATGLCAGTYTVVVTDANGCNSSNSITLTDPVGMTLITSSSNATCGNADGDATVSVSSGTSPYSYSWNNGQTDSTATGLAAGNYSVTVTDNNGCTSSTNVSVNDAGAPTLTIVDSTNVSCNGGNDGSATISASGGTTPYTFLWNDGQTDTIAIGLSGGTYSVTIGDANGCSAATSVTISEPSAISVTISKTNASCNGSCGGTATVSVSGGTAPYTYLWNDGQTNSMAIGLCAGSYTVTVTDANTCTNTSIVAISQPAALSDSVSVTDPTCNGNCDGMASVTVSGGAIPYSYQWNDAVFQTTQTAVGLCAATYYVTVTDANGCAIKDSVTLTNPPGMSLSATTTDATCGNNDGSASVAVSGGTSPYSYQWDDPFLQNSDTATALGAGAYAVTVTDVAGCTAVLTNIAINNTGGPTVSISSSTNVSCNGGNNGSAVVSASGGITPYTYQWSNGQTDSTATGLSSGAYNVVVTDVNGCASTAIVDITEPVALNAAITSTTDASCNGTCDGLATVSVNGGTSPYTYMWSDSSTTATASGLCAGGANVTITDSNGCTTVQSTTISEPPAMTLNATTTDASCGNADGSATVTVSGGSTPYSYQWSSGGNLATENGLVTGTYTCTVTDVGGCSAIVSVNINNAGGPAVTVSGANVSCNGGNDGAAAAIVSGGATPYTYLWDDANAQTNATASALMAGTYTVTVADSTGCSGVVSVTVSEPDSLTLNITSITDASCVVSDGSATVSVSGGTTAYSYSWSNGDIGATADSLAAGTYTCVITDANGCIDSILATISVTGQPTLSITSTDVGCNGDSTGTATANVSGGSGSYSYQWSDGQTTQIATGLSAGMYSLTVTDSLGCTVSDSVTISKPAALALSFSTVDAACDPYNNGNAVVAVTGGTSPYSYQWNDSLSQTTDSAISLASGNYSVTVTDSSGCAAADSITIGVKSNLTISIVATDDTCFTKSGTFTITATGGVEPYSYYFISDTGVPSITNSSATGLGPDLWVGNVIDSVGCSREGIFEINATIPPFVTGIITDETCEDYADGMIDLTVSGSSPFSYSWSNSATLEDVNGLSAGSYSVTVTDSSGCTDTSSYALIFGTDNCLNIPTVFTPNDDGVNDVWNIGFVSSPNMRMEIYNEWGSLVFESNGYSVPWDGTNKNGKELPAAAYYFIIDLDDGIQPHTGTITIVR